MNNSKFVIYAAILALLLSCSGNFEPIPYESRTKLNSVASSEASSSSTEESSSSTVISSSSIGQSNDSSSSFLSSSSPEQGGNSSSSTPTSTQSSSSAVFSSSSIGQGGSSSSSIPSSNSVASSSSAATSQCGGKEFQEFQFCYENTIYDKCDRSSYNPTSIICCSNKQLSIYDYGCCSNKEYTLETHFCNTNIIYDKCGGGEYDLETYFCDVRDKALYKYVTIGEQIWMAKNLNYAASGSKCGGSDGKLTDNNTENCNTYGRLYRGVNDLCPKGWHIPSNDDWNKLIEFVGGPSTAGTKLKSKSGWNNNIGIPTGTDDYDFSALPGGYGANDNGFYSAGYRGYWGSYSKNGSTYTYVRSINYDKTSVDEETALSAFSVRCIRD
jgi:uncharacterized protein (TIGR02145 family)